uniref:RGM_C domain-containing protein n=1 Tax=Meloidogyne hapla TaxID=6305 RepID=A0A1I8B4H8_MELHA
MRKSIQKFWADCDESSTDGICSADAKFQSCDKMFIEYDKEHFKILVPVGKGDNSTTTESSGMKNSTIILLVVGVTLL